ncbi:MAG: PEP/pyruvate-binding domain-containing protein, partial [Armatimonadota bacterium]|nr:PEP/pyruvate-binding domain-containing protein [Armatimonadota bacterium]
MAEKLVYLFAEGNKDWRDLLGGKGANLAEMTNIGLPVPPGFTITTDACRAYYANKHQVPAGLWDEVAVALKKVEEQTGKGFGDPNNPLLVSVRSGAKFSMPGMMDTVLNLGLNEATLEGIIRLTGNPRFAYDAYRRFIMMFSDIVLSDDYPALKKHEFEHIFDALKAELGAKQDTDVDAEGLKKLVGLYKEYFKKVTGFDFPTDPMDQLHRAIEAVFRSWNNERARIFREREKISHDLGTAVNVQTMVFGNMGNDSGTGVAFTRDPATGEKQFYGEFLMNAQGEDVVAGIRKTRPISELPEVLPEAAAELWRVFETLEKAYRDMCDIEF